jgi:hypothetical protein
MIKERGQREDTPSRARNEKREGGRRFRVSLRGRKGSLGEMAAYNFVPRENEHREIGDNIKTERVKRKRNNNLIR